MEFIYNRTNAIYDLRIAGKSVGFMTRTPANRWLVYIRGLETFAIARDLLEAKNVAAKTWQWRMNQ